MEGSDAGQWVSSIRDGETSKREIRGVLGPQDQDWEDGRVVAYRARTTDGAVYFGALAVSTSDAVAGVGKLFDHGHLHVLLIEYDAAEVVRRHEIVKLPLSASEQRIGRTGQEWAAGATR